MLTDAKIKVVQNLLLGLSKEEIIWVNGYLSGIVSLDTKSDNNILPLNGPVKKITVTYGTETGNAKKLASLFAARAKKNGMQVKLVALDQYRLSDLSKEEKLIIVISTHGEGEPPAAAKNFYDHLHQTDQQLTNLTYAVLALGDSSYPRFCQTGEDVDEQLQRLGGKPLLSLLKVDTDYLPEADQWFSSLLNVLSDLKAVLPVLPTSETRNTGKNFYDGIIRNIINLNANGSAKETYHIEIVAEGVEYEPGDSLGIIPVNDKELVDKIIARGGIIEQASILTAKENRDILDLLLHHLSIVNLSERVLNNYRDVVQKEIPSGKTDFLDLLIKYPVTDSQQFLAVVQILEKITPRLYSISSSPSAHEGEIHITVAKHEFTYNEQQRKGLCSNHISVQKEGVVFPFYIHKNSLFKLPTADKDVIMIGPGTGIAPFRAFIAERDATGAEGRNWLFFGDQHFTTDFLYQTEWQNWLELGSLTKMNVAFSRDEVQKSYVQHKLLQHGAEVLEWIENGAYFFICGAKDPMSIDVENALLQIIRQQNNVSEEDAMRYLNNLKEEERFIKDVY